MICGIERAIGGERIKAEMVLRHWRRSTARVCGPAKVHRSGGGSPGGNERAVLKEIENFKTNGPTDKQLADVKETFLRDDETNMKQNGYLLAQIALRYEYGEDLTSLFHLPDYYRKLDVATIKSAAQKYLNPTNLVRVTLFPEKTAAPDLPAAAR